MDHSVVRNNRSANLFLAVVFVSPNDESLSLIEFKNSTFKHNNYGYYNYYTPDVQDRIFFENCVFMENQQAGIFLDNYSAGHFTGCTFTNNGWVGMYIYNVSDPDGVSFQNSNIYGNSQDDVYVECCSYSGVDLDFRYSYWGEETTAEMNEGDNPKNISKIRDWYDHGEEGMIVNYAGWVGGSGVPGYTADVMFTDSEYNEIGPEYPAGTETVYFEVYDADITGSLDVTLTSDTDTEGETLTLNEVDGETGYFRGSIPVGVASTRLLNEDLLPARMEQLRSQYPDHNDENLKSACT
jgi:hypothetical protein